VCSILHTRGRRFYSGGYPSSVCKLSIFTGPPSFVSSVTVPSSTGLLVIMSVSFCDVSTTNLDQGAIRGSQFNLRRRMVPVNASHAAHRSYCLEDRREFLLRKARNSYEILLIASNPMLPDRPEISVLEAGLEVPASNLIPLFPRNSGARRKLEPRQRRLAEQLRSHLSIVSNPLRESRSRHREPLPDFLETRRSRSHPVPRHQ